MADLLHTVANLPVEHTIQIAKGYGDLQHCSNVSNAANTWSKYNITLRL